MNVLICNDDGIKCSGIIKLAEHFSKNNNVLVIAPEDNRSAQAHSLTIGKPIKIVKSNHIKGCESYSISGTPVDCVKIAHLMFKDFNADIVISGINTAHNLGSDILYSGTVSAACEASFYNKISFALSAYDYDENNFELFSIFAEKIINYLLKFSKSGDIWNINFPNLKLGKIKGIKITPLGKHVYSDRYEKISNNEYVLVGELLDCKSNSLDCDVEWIKKGYITVTPILYNKTDYDKISKSFLDIETLF